MENVYKYVKRGENHKKKNMKCQDYVCCGERKGVKAVSLADGAGMNDYGMLGAGVSARYIVSLLLDNFEELYFMDRSTLQYTVAVAIKNKLYEVCDKYGVQLDDVKSTLIACAYEESTQRLILIHLGDGYVVMNCAGRKRIVSYPQNGENRFETYLTSMVPIREKIHIFCGTVKQVEEIYLLSDGWCEFISSPQELLKMVIWEECTKERVCQDDLSMICLRCA